MNTKITNSPFLSLSKFSRCIIIKLFSFVEEEVEEEQVVKDASAALRISNDD